MNVLIVDDSISVRKALERILSSRAFHSITASSAEEAISLLSSEELELVIADIIMPGMNGFDLCRHIRGQSRFDALPVLLISGIVNAEVSAHAVAVGAVDIVKKPFTPDDLFPKIDRALAVNRAVADTVVADVIAEPEEADPVIEASSSVMPVAVVPEPENMTGPANTVEIKDEHRSESLKEDEELLLFDEEDDFESPDTYPPLLEVSVSADAFGKLDDFLTHSTITAALLIGANGDGIASAGTPPLAMSSLTSYTKTLGSIASVLGSSAGGELSSMHLEYSHFSLLIVKLTSETSLVLCLKDSSSLGVAHYLVRKYLRAASEAVLS